MLYGIGRQFYAASWENVLLETLTLITFEPLFILFSCFWLAHVKEPRSIGPQNGCASHIVAGQGPSPVRRAHMPTVRA